jgi:hypothetical protein
VLDERFVLLGAAIGSLGSLSYLIATIRGRARPNRVTFFFWAFAPLIAFAAELAEGVRIQSIMTLMVGVSPLAIFLASFVNPRSDWRLTRFDVGCGILALGGLALWAFTREGNLAIVFSIAADAFAAIPTIVKSYSHPESENRWLYLASAINAGVTLLTVREWTFAYYGFPAYILAVCIFIFSLVSRPRTDERIRRTSGDPSEPLMRAL